MKLTLITSVLFLLFTTVVMAQESKSRSHYDQEKLETARVAFITTRLNLTTIQAEKFWPIFNEFSENRSTNLRTISGLSRTKDENISESDAKSRLNQRFDIQRKMIVEEEKFVKDLSSVVTYNQILQLNGVMREFTRHIYQRQRK
jgi:hypothetical protein